jgi:hypothetical protein
MSLSVMSIDELLEPAKRATPDEWRVNVKIDDSGDYVFREYSVVSLRKYYKADHLETQTIASIYYGPFDAILMAGAKQLASEVSRLRKQLEEYKKEATE